MRKLLLAVLLLLAAPAARAQDTPADNSEMAAIFADDQAIRGGEPIDPQEMRRSDAEHRRRTRELFDGGKLVTANDFYGAAFVFQHGQVPEDFLLAHIFAVRSLGLGRKDAEWIAAATLDRYLQNIGREQVYGTQYRFDPESGATMGPYNRTLLTDDLKIAAGVHSVAEQEARLPEMEAMMRARAAPAAKP